MGAAFPEEHIIHVEHLTKHYQRVVRKEGLLASLRTLVDAQYETVVKEPL